MINHARTLLLNEPGRHLESTVTPGDVFIPEYSPVDFGVELNVIRRTLFGTNPDYDGLLYRTAQYMAVLHSTEFEAYVLNFDLRLTYDPEDPGLEDEAAYGAFVTPTDDDVQMTVSGSWNEDAILGRAITRWVVTATSSTTVSAQNTTIGAVREYDVTDVQKLLPGSTLVFAFSRTTLTPGDRWDVEHRARPIPDIGIVTEELSALSSQIQAKLFTDQRDPLKLVASLMSEPYLSFYRLFTEHYAQPFRLMGALLALIYRTEELNSNARAA